MAEQEDDIYFELLEHIGETDNDDIIWELAPKIKDRDNKIQLIIQTVVSNDLHTLQAFKEIYNINLNAVVNDNDDNLVIIACENNQPAILVYLIMKQVSVNHQNKDERTGLIIACMSGFWNIINILLNYHFTDVTVTDKYDHNALYYLLTSDMNVDEHIMNKILNGNFTEYIDEQFMMTVIRDNMRFNNRAKLSYIFNTMEVDDEMKEIYRNYLMTRKRGRGYERSDRDEQSEYGDERSEEHDGGGERSEEHDGGDVFVPKRRK